MGVGEARVRRGDQYVAGERDLEAAGDRDTVDRTDHRLRAQFDGLHRILVGAFRIGGAEIGRVGAEFLEVEPRGEGARSEEHTSELQSLMRNSYAVLCLK